MVGNPDNYPKIQTLLDEHLKGRAALVVYIKKTGKHKSALKATEPSDDEDDETSSDYGGLNRILGKPKPQKRRHFLRSNIKEEDDELARGEIPKKKKKVSYTENEVDPDDLPAVVPLKTPQKLLKPSLAEMAAYYEETIRAGANITLLITILLNETKLLVEIVQGK
jgi:hypothetical protein